MMEVLLLSVLMLKQVEVQTQVQMPMLMSMKMPMLMPSHGPLIWHPLGSLIA